VFYVKKKLKGEARKTVSSGSEYERDESSYSDSDNVVGAEQYDLQDEVSP
jgi:hypothetical protein